MPVKLADLAKASELAKKRETVLLHMSAITNTQNYLVVLNYDPPESNDDNRYQRYPEFPAKRAEPVYVSKANYQIFLATERDSIEKELEKLGVQVNEKGELE